MEHRAALERVLDAQGWDASKVLLYRVIGYAGRMAREGGAWSGVQRRVLRNSAFSYPPLETGPEDEAAIKRLLDQAKGMFVHGPKGYASMMDPALSVAIRRHGDLVGWLIGVTQASEAARALGFPASVVVDYRESYLDSVLWNTGAVLGAYHRCFLEQARLFGEEHGALKGILSGDRLSVPVIELGVGAEVKPPASLRMWIALDGAGLRAHS